MALLITGRNEEENIGENDHKHDGSEMETPSYLMQIKCKCEEANAAEDELYVCNDDECIADFYCEDCGPYYHHHISKKKRKNHAFQIDSNTILSLNHLLEKEEDANKFKLAHDQLIALIGVKRYNRVKPYVEKPMSLIASNVPMIAELTNELKSFFSSVQVAVDAHQAAQSATTFAHELALEHSFIPSMEAYMLRFSAVFGEPSPEKAKALKRFTNAKRTEMQLAEQAKNSMNGTISMKRAIKAGAIGMGVATSIEMSWHAYRYQQGQICGKEWCRLLGKSLFRNSASLIGTAAGGQVGGLLGCKLGVAIGSTISPGLGTALGGGVGILCGIFFGYLMGKGAETVYEEYFPENKTEEQHKERLLKDALLYFNFLPKDIKNKRIFNEKMLKKLFKEKALRAHPDRRRDGDHSAWYELSTHYGFLKALLEQNEADKKIVSKSIDEPQAITL